MFTEPKDKKEVPELFLNFDAAVRDHVSGQGRSGGALLFAVCRGKVGLEGCHSIGDQIWV